MTAEPNKSMMTLKHESIVTKPFEGEFTFHLTNLTGGDVQFLTDITALFCDPKNRALLEGLRAGRMGLYRDPQTHRCLASDLFTPPVVMARQTSKN